MTDFHTAGPVRLRLSLPAGLAQVTATETERSTVEVHAHHDSDKAAHQLAEQTQVELRGDELIVEVPRGYRLRRTPELDVRITLPLGSAVTATVASADLRAHGRLGRVQVDSASGDVEIEEALGEVEIRTASGDSRVGRCEGRVRVKSASGNVAVDVAAAGVDVSSASGDVTVGETTGSSTARSASGDFTVRTARSGDIEANTASGDVRVGVAAGTGVYLDLSTLSGEAISHLQPEARPAEGRPELQLRLRTLSGDIDVVRSG
ncbi:MAG: DUF4097 family beta strand repeat-containing protein [Pseudonocardiales bacterium]